MRVLGIDPGRSGALALLGSGAAMVEISDMPSFSKHISEDMLAELVRRMRPDVAWIEAVHAMPKQGVTSMFSFGCSFGIVRGVLSGLGVPREFVTPGKWKRTFSLGADKSAVRLRAAQLFPSAATMFQRHKDDGRAEAALLALYGLRMLNGHDCEPSFLA